MSITVKGYISLPQVKPKLMKLKLIMNQKKIMSLIDVTADVTNFANEKRQEEERTPAKERSKFIPLRLRTKNVKSC